MTALDCGAAVFSVALAADRSSGVLAGEGVKLVRQPLGIHPAQRMASDGELSGIIAQHRGLAPGRRRERWLPPEAVRTVLEKAVKPPATLGRWSCRMMAPDADISQAVS